MRMRSFALLVFASALLFVAVKGAVAFPSQEIFYTVRYSCIASPDMRGHIEGEWVTHCDGTTTGWGWEPGHNCTTTDITWGNSCSGGGGGGGEDPVQN